MNGVHREARTKVYLVEMKNSNGQHFLFGA